MAGVSTRQINRWAAAGFLTVVRGANGASGTEPSTYDPSELEVARASWDAMMLEERLRRRGGST